MMPSLRYILLISALVAACISTDAQKSNTTRRQLKPDAAQISPTVAEVYDTIGCSPTDIVMSGYDKPARSSRESAFFTNRTGRDVVALILNLRYFDEQGRALHSIRRIVKGSLPAGATRQIDWNSWDRQQSFRYKRSFQGRRSQAVPFDVVCAIDSIVVVPLQ